MTLLIWLRMLLLYMSLTEHGEHTWQKELPLWATGRVKVKLRTWGTALD